MGGSDSRFDFGPTEPWAQHAGGIEEAASRRRRGWLVRGVGFGCTGLAAVLTLACAGLVMYERTRPAPPAPPPYVDPLAAHPYLGDKDFLPGVAAPWQALGELPHFSPDGKHLAVATEGVTRAYEYPSGVLIGELAAVTQGDIVSQLSFSPDGSRLCVSTYNFNHPRIWRPTTGDVLELAAEECQNAAFVPDGRVVATISTETSRETDKPRDRICLWDAETGKMRSQATLETAHARLHQFAADGKLLVLTHGRDTTLWDLTRNRPVTPAYASNKKLRGPVRYSPDGRLVASVLEGENYVYHVCVSETATGREVSRHTLERVCSPQEYEFTRDGSRLACTCSGGVTRVLDTRTGEPVMSFRPRDWRVKQGGVFSPSGETMFVHSLQGIREVALPGRGQVRGP